MLVRQVKSPTGKAARHRLQVLVLLAPVLALPSCSTVQSVKTAVLGGGSTTPQVLSGFIGGAAADDPRAALAARDVLATGGNAADAAVAAAFMMSVSLPSRASLGASGACLAYKPGDVSPQAILFEPTPGGPGGDRPAAVPMLARGLFLLNARYGSRDFASLIAPAETAAREGIPASRALVEDLNDVAAPLLADPSSAAIFAPNGAPLAVGDTLIQPDLGAMLGQIREFGVGDFYDGALATNLIAAVKSAGGGAVSIDTLRNALPTVASPIIVEQAGNSVAFVPGEGGLAASAALTGAISPAAAELPASTSLIVVDGKGDAVGCAFSMNNLFGTGRLAPGTGIVLGASPLHKPNPLIAVAIAWKPGLNAFRAAAAGTGQAAAPAAAAAAMSAALQGSTAPIVPDPGRYNVASCDQYLPGNDKSCHFATDPRGAGLATASD